MSKKPASGAPKKARWSTEKKSIAAKKPHRGQGGPTGQTSAGHTVRTSRPASTTSSHVGGREWRAPRDEHRPFERNDRSASGGARPSYNSRDDRGERPSYNNRDDRGARPSYNNRDDRPAFKRDDRGERPSYNNRDDRDTRGGYQRRDDRGARASSGFGDDRSGHDAEAERMDADTWTKSTRADVSDGPVEVAADNGFAALGLPEKLVERLAREGITTPFPIQTATIPDALAGKDVLGRGQTGSGKTLAFGLPLITRLIVAGQRRLPRRPHALILTPTRELAMQISDALEPLVHVAGLRHKLIAGGLSYTTQINA
ncbi:MAG: DEAD/DEAH box helicase, partial [Terracoccus sp.]